MSSKWDKDRTARYFKLYGDPREMKGSQSQLCKDVASLLNGKSGIDFGAGMGHIIPHLRKDFHYVGLDSSPDMLDVARILFESPNRKFILADVIMPRLRELIGTLSPPNTPSSQFDNAISVSLFIHLSRDEMLEALKNMASFAYRVVFSMETLDDSEVIRKDGIRIRNQKPESVLADLTELGFRNISWQHQCSTYQLTQTVYTMRDNPLRTEQNMITRTTLFTADSPGQG